MLKKNLLFIFITYIYLVTSILFPLLCQLYSFWTRNHGNVFVFMLLILSCKIKSDFSFTSSLLLFLKLVSKDMTILATRILESQAHLHLNKWKNFLRRLYKRLNIINQFNFPACITEFIIMVEKIIMHLILGSAGLKIFSEKKLLHWIERVEFGFWYQS